MTDAPPVIAVLGASGLIGEAVCRLLARDAFAVVPVARRFTQAQKSAFGDAAIECPFVDGGMDALARVLANDGIDIVVNCVGVPQDSRRGDTREVHAGFVGRLMDVLSTAARPRLLIHLSIPGDQENDRTSFSRTKREAESAILAGEVPYVILRPGFVVTTSAYGGGAAVRALAMLPLDLPADDRKRPFQVVAMADIAATLAGIARRWRGGERHWAHTWNVMAREPSTLGQVIDAFRDHLGGPAQRLLLPSGALDLGARAGDFAGLLGWSPPIRTTALREIRRGVAGDPEPWIAATRLSPRAFPEVVRDLPSSVQERWFARLYFVKPLIFGSLALFWIVSGLIALTVSIRAAIEILTTHGMNAAQARSMGVGGALADLAVGMAIAFRPASRAGLLSGICVAVFYLAGASLIIPELWIDPLGTLVKTVPIVVLMIVAPGMLDDR